MLFAVNIAKHEIGLKFVNGDYRGVLDPGRHAFPERFVPGRRVAVQKVSVLRGLFEHALLDVFVQDRAFRERVEVIAVAAGELAVVQRDALPVAVLGPGRHAYVKGPFELNVERFAAEPGSRFAHPKLDAVLRAAGADAFFREVVPPAGSTALVYQGGSLVDRLPPGRHVLFEGPRLDVKIVDLREKHLELQGQDIVTADKVSLRVNLTVAYRVADPERALAGVADYEQSLYRIAQLALREAVGSRTLETLLAEKRALGDELLDAVRTDAQRFGLTVGAAGVRDVILPGEMKALLNNVIEAEQRAKAELIRRREETAAARSQANTAKLIEQHPTLARQRELELLAGVLAGAQVKLFVGDRSLGDTLAQLVGARTAGDDERQPGA